jgi:hypothetical protein
VLQLVRKQTTTDVMGMIVFNIFSTYEDIGTGKYSNYFAKMAYGRPAGGALMGSFSGG